MLKSLNVFVLLTHKYYIVICNIVFKYNIVLLTQAFSTLTCTMYTIYTFVWQLSKKKKKIIYAAKAWREKHQNEVGAWAGLVTDEAPILLRHKLITTEPLLSSTNSMPYSGMF